MAKSIVRSLKKSQRIRIILDGISFRCKVGELDNCMDHTNQLLAVKLAIMDLLIGEGTGIGTTKNGFQVQVDLL
jgi:hypothetical protein